MAVRGTVKQLNKSILIQDSILGIEKPLALFLIGMLFIVWQKAGLMSIAFLIALGVFGVGLLGGKALYKKDPFKIRNILSGFFMFEIRNRFLFAKSIRGKSLDLSKKNPLEVTYISTMRKDRK